MFGYRGILFGYRGILFGYRGNLFGYRGYKMFGYRGKFTSINEQVVCSVIEFTLITERRYYCTSKLAVFFLPLNKA